MKQSEKPNTLKKKYLMIMAVILITVFVVCVSSFTICAAENNNSASIGNVKKSDMIKARSKYDGKKIGVENASSFVLSVGDYFKNPDVYYFRNTPDALSALESGKIDAFLGDEPTLRYYITQIRNADCEVIDDNGGDIGSIAAKTKQGEKLIGKYNRYIRKLKDDGELKRLEAKWFYGSENDRVMHSYSDYPATNGTLSIATDCLYPPFEYLKNGQLMGFEIEIITGFCKAYGYKPHFINADLDGILSGVSSGKYDLGVNAFTVTEERKKAVYFTDAYYVDYAGVAYMKGSNIESGSFLDKAKDGFVKTFIDQSRWKMFVSGALVTMLITVMATVLGTLLGFLIHLLCRRGNRFTNRVSVFCRWIVLGIPEVVALMIAFYIIAGKSSVSGLVVAICVFTVIFGCTVHNMIESGEKSFDSGQHKAAVTMGYSEMEAFRKIMLPQIARTAAVDYRNSITALLKATAVVGYITVMDITKVGDIIRGNAYEAIFPLLSVAAVYFIIDGILRLIVRLLTRKLDFEKRNKKQILKGAVIK